MQRRLRLGPTQSPVVSTTLNRRHTQAKAASAIRWGAVCLLLALPLLLDLYLNILSYYIGLRSTVVWYTELCILVILLLSCLYNCVFFSNVALSHPQVKLTPAQKKLLRVSDGSGDGCYETVNTPTPFGTPLSQPSTSINVSPLALLTPTRHPITPRNTPRSSHGTPLSNHTTPAHTTSPYSSVNGIISSQEVLESYLRSEGEREEIQYLAHGSPDVAWQPTRHTPEQPSNLRKYHVATRSQSPASDGSSGLVTEDQTVWAELDISRDKLVQWTENCRRWIAETVVIPVSMEIDKINRILSKGAAPTVKIGTTSLSTLKRECKTKGPQVPTLHLVLPYLEFTTKQGYLVNRINELAGGGCLSVYRWNGGGTWNGMAWNQDLPSDPQILMHLLCTYLDNHLPLSPLSSDGRPFSSKYLLKHPDKPVANTSDVVIYQTAINPPHYNIIVGKKMVELPRGRNNLFHAVVAMLHQLKTKKAFTIGTAGTTMASLQMLWIVE